MQLLKRGNHVFEMIDVLAMNDEIRGEGDAKLAGLMLANPSSQFNFVRMRARTRNPVRVAFGRILKTELDMIETRFHKLPQPVPRKPYARGDQIRIKA